MPLENYNPGDKILAALSYKQQLTWIGFKRICNSVTRDEYVYDDIGNSQQVDNSAFMQLRLLENLGHCDSSFSGTHHTVTIAPPVLVRLPLAGAPQAIVIGSRAGSTFDEVANVASQHAGIIVEQQACEPELPFSPSRIFVQSSSPSEMTKFAEQLRIYYSNSPAAWSILHFAGSIQQYYDSLIWTEPEILAWSCHIFNHEAGRFKRGIDDGTAILVNYTNPVTNTRIHFYRKYGKQAEVNRDWGRYLLFKDKASSVLVYDERKCIMGVPITCPLPRLYARVLTLCSGHTPICHPLNKDGLNWYYYRCVPKQIAVLLAEKLAQTLTPVTFDKDNYGVY